MELRTKFGALLGAGGLLLLAASAVFAGGGGPPTYTITVEKSADPANVPPSGGTVEYTVSVTATGTGFFQVVNVDDGMTGCTLGAPTGDDGDGNLEPAETWNYSCTVTDVEPETVNTATVNACHNAGGSCNQSSHDATGSDAVTVGEGDEVDPTDPPATDPPGSGDPVDPTFDGNEGGATEPATDGEVATGGTGQANNAIMLVLALGLLLGSIVFVTPARAVRQRR